MRAGNVELMIEVFSVRLKTDDIVATAIDYFGNNRETMRYAQFRSQRHCVLSGIVEDGCTRSIGQRLKRNGMHSTLLGANDIIALRCNILSGRFDSSWNRIRSG